MLFEESYDDVRLKFMNSCFRATIFNQTGLMYTKRVVHLTDDGRARVVSIAFAPEESADWLNMEITRNDLDEMSFEYPIAGYRNFPGGSIYGARKVSRQVRRGVCSRTWSWLHPRTPLLTEADYRLLFNEPLVTTISNSLDYARILFDPDYFSVAECLEKIHAEGWIRAAFSASFEIGYILNCSYPVLHYKTIPIGIVDNERFRLKGSASPLVEQLTEAGIEINRIELGVIS